MYVILEAHHRAEEDSVTDIWDVIRRLYAAHPDLKSARDNREFVFAARITLAAWHTRAVYLQKGFGENADVRPAWIMEICANFELTPPGLPVANGTMGENGIGGGSDANAIYEMAMDFDFDLLDWTAWENFGNLQ